MNNKHCEIIKYLRTVDQATLAEIYRNGSFFYYRNWEKHLGGIMSTMVRQGLVTRIKPGLFKLGGKPQQKPVNNNSNQLTLL
jgi:hypothetical protein